jgi:hypothetical protein
MQREKQKGSFFSPVAAKAKFDESVFAKVISALTTAGAAAAAGVNVGAIATISAHLVRTGVLLPQPLGGLCL